MVIYKKGYYSLGLIFYSNIPITISKSTDLKYETCGGELALDKTVIFSLFYIVIKQKRTREKGKGHTVEIKEVEK